MKFNYKGSGEFKDDKLSLEFEVDILDQSPMLPSPEEPKPKEPEPEEPEPEEPSNTPPSPGNPYRVDEYTANIQPVYDRGLEAPSILYRRSSWNYFGKLVYRGKNILGRYKSGDAVGRLSPEGVDDPREINVYSHQDKMYASVIHQHGGGFHHVHFEFTDSLSVLPAQAPVEFDPAPTQQLPSSKPVALGDIHVLGMNDGPAISWWKYDEYAAGDYKRHWFTSDDEQCVFELPPVPSGVVRYDVYGFSVRPTDTGWVGIVGLLGITDLGSQRGNMTMHKMHSSNGIVWQVVPEELWAPDEQHRANGYMVFPHGVPRQWGNDWKHSFGIMHCSHGTWRYASDKFTGCKVLTESWS